MSGYSPEQILDKFFELHERIGGSDRPVSIAKVTRLAGGDPFKTRPTVTYDWEDVLPLPIVTDAPDEVTLQTIGGSLGRDERLFTFHPESLAPRDPIETLGERIEKKLRELTGAGRGALKYGETVYSISRFYATPALIRVVPQWIVVATQMVK